MTDKTVLDPDDVLEDVHIWGVFSVHIRLDVVEDFGQTYLVCGSCGASWSVHRGVSAPLCGYLYRPVAVGDGWCEERGRDRIANRRKA